MNSFDQLVKSNPDLTILIVERYWYYSDSNITEFSAAQVRPRIASIRPLSFSNNSSEWLAKCFIKDRLVIILATEYSVDILDTVPACWTYRMLSAVPDD